MLSNEKILNLKALLEDQKKGISDAIDLARAASEPVELDQSLQGRVSRGDALQQQEMAKAGLARNRQHLHHIISALKRIDEGTYGICLGCEEYISEQRLAIMPETTLCIKCQEKAS